MAVCSTVFSLAGLTPDTIADLAVRATVCEAAAIGKPGLVCMDTQGAHTDMDIQTLMASAFSLRAYFAQACALGAAEAQRDPIAVFPHLRRLGCLAEATMFAATGGVNTHKGLIFSMGLFCAAAGRLGAFPGEASPETLCATAAAFAHGIVERDLAPLRARAGAFDAHCQTWAAYAAATNATLQRCISAGETFYLRYGISGIRGEAEQGFPHVLEALQTLAFWLDRTDFNAALLNALLAIMGSMPDTNILWRGGMEELHEVQRYARDILHHGGAAASAGSVALADLRQYCLSKRLSPGGSADILSVALFVHLLRRA